MNHKFSYITDLSRNPIILFQVQDCTEQGMKTVGWAFLRLHDQSNQAININRRLRLQLFQPPTQLESTNHELDQASLLVSLINENRKIRIRSSIHVTITDLLPFDKRSDKIIPTQRSTRPDVKEVGKSQILIIESNQSLADGTGNETENENLETLEWKRPPGQTSLFPNVLYDKSEISEISEFGGFCCKFSPNGANLAWTTASQFEHKIIIDRFIGNQTGSRKLRFTVSAHSGLIYDLDWSHDSNYLIACSADQTASVWRVPESMEIISGNSTKGRQPYQLGMLPAPCYLYSAKFNPTSPLEEIYLFGQDGNCYIFTHVENEFLLKNEIQISSYPINSATIRKNFL